MSQKPSTWVTALQGKVEVQEAGRWRPVRLMEGLAQGSQLRTGSGALLELGQADGTVMRLGASSQLSLGAPPPPGTAFEVRMGASGLVPGGGGVRAGAGSWLRLEGGEAGVQVRLLAGQATLASGQALPLAQPFTQPVAPAPVALLPPAPQPRPNPLAAVAPGPVRPAPQPPAPSQPWPGGTQWAGAGDGALGLNGAGGGQSDGLPGGGPAAVGAGALEPLGGGKGGMPMPLMLDVLGPVGAAPDQPGGLAVGLQ